MKLPTIVLLIERSREFGRGLIRGIAKYSRLHGPWTFYLRPEFYLKRPSNFEMAWLRDIKPDGIIMRQHEHTREILKLGVPVILANTVLENELPGIPYIDTDSYLVGQKAAEHFLSRGFKQFAFFGLGGILWADRRLIGFKYHLEKAGFPHIDALNLPKTESASSNKKQNEIVRKWLLDLPKPIGLMACNDDQGRKLIDIAKRTGLSVPEEIAVLGVDNDEIVCDLCNPPLSSIPLHTERAGYEAAELLNQLINGRKPDKTKIIVPVLDVVEKQSTDIMATEDHSVALALRFIRERIYEPISIHMIADHVGISVRTLHRKFLKVVGRSIFSEMRRLRISLIKRLLIETDLSVAQIAYKLGYTSYDHIARYFSEETGQTPAEFRKQYK